MLFANIEMFIAINKFYKLFLFMVFVWRNAGQNGCHALFVRRNDLRPEKMVAIRSLSGESGLSPDKAMSESGRLTGCA